MTCCFPFFVFGNGPKRSIGIFSRELLGGKSSVSWLFLCPPSFIFKHERHLLTWTDASPPTINLQYNRLHNCWYQRLAPWCPCLSRSWDSKMIRSIRSNETNVWRALFKWDHQYSIFVYIEWGLQKTQIWFFEIRYTLSHLLLLTSSSTCSWKSSNHS